jgi:polar amino acid transport system permease protein
MSPWKVLKRIWLPQAIRHVLPTLAGETISQLKATPLAFTIPVMDLMGVTSRIRQDTYLTYEPLLFLALVYIVLTFLITRAFNYFEGLVPSRR